MSDSRLRRLEREDLDFQRRLEEFRRGGPPPPEIAFELMTENNVGGFFVIHDAQDPMPAGWPFAWAEDPNALMAIVQHYGGESAYPESELSDLFRWACMCRPGDWSEFYDWFAIIAVRRDARGSYGGFSTDMGTGGWDENEPEEGQEGEWWARLGHPIYP